MEHNGVAGALGSPLIAAGVTIARALAQIEGKERAARSGANLPAIEPASEPDIYARLHQEHAGLAMRLLERSSVAIVCPYNITSSSPLDIDRRPCRIPRSTRSAGSAPLQLSTLLLQSLVRRIPGRTDIGSREVIEFSSFDAAERLSETFARAITQRWEGFVLKGCDDPYFSFNGSRPFIKLKKDYIPSLGDTADFAIIGGRSDAADEHELGIGSLWWTSFYIGCVDNKDEVCRFNAKPRFRIIDTVDRHGISKENITYLNRHGYFTRAPFAKSMPGFDIIFEPARRLQPVELFKHPFIVEVVGAGFDKPANVEDS